MVREINVGEFNEKSASYSSKGGGIYLGTVLSLVNNLPQVSVPDLGCVFKDIEFIGRTNTFALNINDQVLCAFLGHQTNAIYILGAVSKKIDVFASITSLTALTNTVTGLNAALTALEARVTALEN